MRIERGMRQWNRAREYPMICASGIISQSREEAAGMANMGYAAEPALAAPATALWEMALSRQAAAKHKRAAPSAVSAQESAEEPQGALCSCGPVPLQSPVVGIREAGRLQLPGQYRSTYKDHARSPPPAAAEPSRGS